MMTRAFRAVLAMIALSSVLPAQAAPAVANGLIKMVEGDWLTENNESIIRLYNCGSAVCGMIAGVTGFAPDGSGPKGANGTPTCGRVIVRDMHLDDDGVLQGSITDPRNDTVYNASIRIGDHGELRLRGYVGISLLGSTQIWQPAHARFGKDCRFTLVS
jgi:uncharacterized protein (DUF2147 family)